VVGFQPDGDSLRFRADHWSNWSDYGSLKHSNHRVQLRFQGIDTPETHISGTHQPLDLAFPARDRLLVMLGITNLQTGPSGNTVTSANDQTRGTILVSGSTYGRPIAFVFAGDRFTGTNSGAAFTPTRAQIRMSTNYRLVEEGHAYPLFYKELDGGIRDDFTDAAIDAYNARRGLWPYDWSESFAADNLAELEDNYLVFPKLFRRLVPYMRGGNSTRGFVNALRTGPTSKNDLLRLTPGSGSRIRLSQVLAQQGNSKTIRMLYYPEELVFE
jgi:endonuclease YncB( thermonuclease family)